MLDVRTKMKTSRWSYQATVPRKQKLVSIWATPFQQEIAGAVLFAVCMFFSEQRESCMNYT
jgi:hypothetical protein